MSAVRGISGLVSLTSKAALNPVITAALLWALTSAPARVRDALPDALSSLRDPQALGGVVKALKWLLAIGVAGTVNQKLNELSLNAYRVKNDKARWSWTEEVAVVTGGCGSIGELTVKRLITQGVKVAILDIQKLPPSLQDHANVQLFPCDVTNPDAVSSAAKQVTEAFGAPSILINNAGIAKAHTILDTSPEYLRKIFEVNLFSNWYTVQAFLPDMLAKNKGHIVTVASIASYLGVATMADYCATKAALLAFHETLNQEIRQKHKAPGILTSSIHPEWVRTPLIEPFEKALEASGSRIQDPRVIAETIADQVLTCSGGQVFIPKGISRVSGLRGWPNWLQEAARGAIAKTVLSSVK